jgi:hypothetical protein
MVLAQKQTWKKIEDLDIKLCSYSQMIFDKGAKNTGEKSTSSTNGAGDIDCLHTEA